MPVVHVNKTEQYQTGSGSLRLRAWIGHNQHGTINAWIGSTPITSSASIDKNLGPVTTLINQPLRVISTVQDILSSTNDTSLTIELSDSNSGRTYPYQAAVAVNGGAVIYDITINLR